MKKSILKRISLALVLIVASASFAGCGNGGVSGRQPCFGGMGQ